MTKKSLDNSATRSGSGSITRHPAFPAVVALWFMVLLGLGGLLLPVALLERLVELSHLASLVPAAAPPLGFTAELMVAIGLGAIGAVLGFRIARRVTGASSRDETRLDTPATSRAFNVATDLGADDDETPKHPLRRRRALAVADLGPADEKISPYAEPEYDDAPAYSPASDYEAEKPVIEVLPPEPGFHEWRRAEEVFEEPVEIDVPVIEAAPDSIEIVQAAEPVPTLEESEPVGAPKWLEPERVVEAEFNPVLEPARMDRPSTPLDDLNITQLVERFADTVRRRREWLTSAPQSWPAPIEPIAIEVEAFEPARTPDLPPVEPFPAEEEPAAKRPPFFDWLHRLDVEPLDEGSVPGFSFAMDTAAFVSPPLQPDADEPDAEADAEAEGGVDDDDDVYGSLIEMKNPFAPPRSDFIRIETSETESESEIEPAFEQEQAQERPDTARDNLDAETSLRAALAKLQQLSGNI